MVLAQYGSTAPAFSSGIPFTWITDDASPQPYHRSQPDSNPSHKSGMPPKFPTLCFWVGHSDPHVTPMVQSLVHPLLIPKERYQIATQNSTNATRPDCVSRNAVRWVGTEAGVAPDPTWSTGYSGGGDPDSDIFQGGNSIYSGCFSGRFSGHLWGHFCG